MDKEELVRLTITDGHRSFARLDNLGVTIPYRTPTLDVVDEIRWALHGRGRWGRMKVRLHHRLFPAQYRALKKAQEVAIEQAAREFWEEIDERTQNLIDNLGE